jgi:transcription elongation GreA/GreB family factor/very-short-patch-repair endonuclease
VRYHAILRDKAGLWRMEEQTGEYQANDADAIIGEIFSGGITVAEAIERLRTRLLDLSSRNRLLNYRHPKGRSVQIADNPNLNLVFDRLMDSKSVPFKYVPEPDPDTYEGKRPEAKLHAARLGISTSFEFPPNPEGANGHRLHGIQTLLYPADLERQLRKIASEAKTAIEETGSNMLFLVFGFLEFYDSDDSDRAMLAPLLSLPVALAKGGLDRDTGTYQYSVLHSGEDLAENHTLREKMRRDFMLTLPEYEEEEEPESYFLRIEQAISKKRRWKVRRQITLGMLSFGKLAIWADLDSKKNPSLLQSELVKSVFSGGEGGGGGGLHAEDYHIDERPEAAQPLIFDADSSQHSAIIDVLSGKNMVVNGPPGTGKSQTITNIIAAALSKGKKVLFVSEKLAALEVVRHRLNHAGLGHFCLELHSHKTQKKKFLEDIQVRIEQQFPAPSQFQAKMATLQRQKAELARYAELMGSRIGNSIGLTVNEVFWAAERRRQELGDVSAAVNAIGFKDVSAWTHDDLESRRSRLSALAELHDAIGGLFDQNHPCWGFRPDPLAPSDDEAIGRIIMAARDGASVADAAATESVAYFGFKEQPDAASASIVVEAVGRIPPPPDMVEPALLPKMFDADADPKGQRSSRLISDVATGVEKARRLFRSAAEVLADGERIPVDAMDEARQTTERWKMAKALLSSDIGHALDAVSRMEKAADAFSTAARVSGAPYGPAGKIALDSFLANCSWAESLGLAPFPINRISARAAAIIETGTALNESLSRMGAIATKRELSFDGTPNAVARLADPDGIPGLSRDADVSNGSLTEARRLAAFPLSDKSVSELRRLKALLDGETDSYAEALDRCRSSAERMGVSFDSTERSVAELAAMAKVCLSAPSDLLEYRRPNFGHARTAELIGEARVALDAERAGRERFGGIFYLDALAPVADIKSSVAALRRKDGFFAFFDSEWRKARRLHTGLSKEKRKLATKDRNEELAALAAWIEARDAFVSNVEMRDCFGGLFRGLDTDPGRIETLNAWYLSSRATLAECPGLVERFDLTVVMAERIAELSAKAATISSDAELMGGAEAAVRGILGADVVGFREAKAKGWNTALEVLRRAAGSIATVMEFFGDKADSALSPRDALRLMEARADLGTAASALECLMRGPASLRDAGGEELGRLADLVGGRWAEALGKIFSKASKVAETATQALAFAGEDCPLSVAESFARAKAELDTAWDAVATLPQWNRFWDWAGLSGVAAKDAGAARMVLERISPCAKAGRSALEVFTATDEEVEARSILDRFASSDDVRRVLGNLFDGAETNLDRLSATHGWGVAVCVTELPTAVRRRLLAPDAAEALSTSKRLYAEIAEGCSKAREGVESLAKYGSFSWDEWQQQVRGPASGDLPSEILSRLERVAADPGSVLPWSKYLSLRMQARQEGLADFVSALESGKIPSADLASAFEFSAYQSIGRSIYQSYPELSGFNGTAHDKTRADYRALDAKIVSLTGKDFASQIDRRTRVPEGQRGTTVGDFTEMQLLRREINKQRRHIPIRQLVKRAGAALQELKPCFMMGPLSVAQYLEQGTLRFDLVVMDEASQLRPEEAIGAIARGTQLVVVGDPKQLPPTSFFDRMVDGSDDEEDEAPAAISGMESILDICQQLFTPVRSLRWHYRSHHESLIAFSNHHFYKNLIVFPSPYAKNPGLGVKYRYVRGGSYKDRQNAPEAQRVVDAVLEHMIKRPDESLGVVTLNQTQRELIEELLDKKLKTFEEGADFMGRWEAEGWPFFVKNLENVQGDERDVIFISTTFGKAPGTDKVRQNFGPISRPDGWRRLNVLFTRSKRRIELFTSMAPEDIVVDARTPLGTKALRDYLDFAMRGVLVSTDEGERDPDSDFEVSVANVISSLGYAVKPQLGVAGFFIDLAVRNPDRPGEFLAGIECDGATYHSGFSVRDRDRIRQEILESLGWKGRIHRIWSTDWFYDPRRAIARLREFLEERRLLSASEDPGDWEEDVLDEDIDETVENRVAEEVAEAIAAESDTSEDLFVEVGDRVTYCPVDAPNDRHSILIVDSASNVKMGVVNEETPLAKALLGISPGDIGILEIPGQKPRQLHVLKIQRQEELLT